MSTGGVTGKPSQRGASRSRRRSWVLLACAIVLVLVAWTVGRWWEAEPWTAWEGALATYPVPSGWIASAPDRLGYRPAERFIVPDYVPASEELDMYPTRSSRDPCADLRQSLAAWTRTGFVLTGPADSNGGCAWEGRIRGYEVLADVLPADLRPNQDQPQMRIIINPT